MSGFAPRPKWVIRVDLIVRRTFPCRLSLDLSHSCSNGVGRRSCRTFRTNSEETPPWDFQAAAPVARFVTPSARSQFAAFNASAGIARWIPAAGTVRSLYFREPRSRYQVRFAKSRAPATEVQRNER